MTGDDVIARLNAPEPNQRGKLSALREQVDELRALSDGEIKDVIRAIKKRLGSPKLAAEVATLVTDLTRDRAWQVGEAKPEPTAVPWVPLPGTDERAAAIEAAIAADPEAQEPYLIYADYLIERDDFRGAMISTGHALAKNASHKAMRTAFAKLLDEHARAIWGEAPIERKLVRDIEWYMGFVTSCSVIGDVHLRIEDVLGALFDEPGPARFIQRLAIRGYDDTTCGPIARVLAARPRPTLRELAVERRQFGDLSELWPATAQLRRLVFAHGVPALGAFELPRLERLALDLNGYDETTPIDMLRPILAATGTPKLRSLAVTGYDLADELCVALVESPLFPQLTELDLSMGTLGEAGAAALLAHRDKLAHFTKLALDENYLSNARCEQLAGLGPFVSIEYQRAGPDGDRTSVDNE